MKPALLAFLLGFFLLPLRAEDWTTTDGTTYKNVQVLSHNAAYVKILHEDGGGRILLSTLSPDLQKRFGYDPAKAQAIIAATAAADERNKAALAAEKQKIQQRAAGQAATGPALQTALFSVPPDADVPAPTAAATPPASTNTVAVSTPTGSNASATNPADEAAAEEDQNPIATEPSTEIDDWGYGDYGYYGGYGAYYPGYGYRGYRGGWGNHATGGAHAYNSHHSSGARAQTSGQAAPKH